MCVGSVAFQPAMWVTSASGGAHTRAHVCAACGWSQVVEEGYEFFAKRQLVTIFSAPNYCGEFENAGAMMSVDETLMCSFQVRNWRVGWRWDLFDGAVVVAACEGGGGMLGPCRARGGSQRWAGHASTRWAHVPLVQRASTHTRTSSRRRGAGPRHMGVV